METVIVADARHTTMHAASPAVASARVVFLDNIRYLMVMLVLMYHSVGAYTILAPYWPIHDSTSFAVDIIRELSDVFMMPVLYFVAGYFALRSLQKKGVWGFLKDKGRRLLIPWALATLVFLPLVLYDQSGQLVRPFRTFWPWYLGNFPTELRFTQASQAPTTQAVYWFISLLFALCMLLALVYAVARLRWSNAALSRQRGSNGRHSVLVTLLLFGVLTTVAYWASLLLVPDSSWFTLGMFLEFQVTRLVLHGGYFFFGVYAQSRGWFADGKPLGNLGMWGSIGAVLAVVYLTIGQPIFANTAGTAHLSAALLLAFAFVRSFLLLSALIVLTCAGTRYWNYSRGFDQQLADHSYNMYLTHFWFVIGAQEALVSWTGGPVAVKITVVLLATLGLSFAVSRWVLARHSRAFAMVILALFAFCLIARP